MCRKALACIFVLFASACADVTKEGLLEGGIELTRANNPKGAIVLLEKALREDGNFFEARFQLARAYYLVGELDRAERELGEVIRQRPSLRDARIMLARLHLRRARPDDALMEVAGFAAVAPEDVEALELAGLAHAAKGDYSRAMEFLKRAALADGAREPAGAGHGGLYAGDSGAMGAGAQMPKTLAGYPSNRSALYTLAWLEERGGEKSEAIGTYERILRDYPSDFRALCRKGLLYLDSGRHEEAFSASDETMKVYPGLPDGYRLRGLVHFHKKSFREAAVFLQKSLSIRPDVAAYYFLGLCHYHLNELEQALSQFYRTLDLNPSMAHARTLTSLILLRQGRAGDAVVEIKRVIELDGDNAFAHNILGSAYMVKGMFEEGMRELNRAVELDPKLVEAHLKKGLYDLSKGRLEEAEAELSTAVSIAPDLLDSRVILASYYMGREDYGSAVAVLKAGVKGRRTDAVLYGLMAEAMVKEDRADDALKALRRAKESDPEYYPAYLGLASLYLQAGEEGKGIGELKAVVERSPGNLKALLGLASIYKDGGGGGGEEALKYYVEAAKTGATAGYAALAEFHLREGRPGKALEVFREAIQRNPSDAVLYEMRGKALVSLGRFEDALKNFEQLGESHPQLGMSYIVKTFLIMKRPGEAMRRVRKELRKDPESLWLMAEVSRIHTVMGKGRSAVKSAGEIIGKAPQSPVGYLALASAYRAGNEPRKAIEVLRDSLSAKDKKLDIYVMLGNLHVRMKDYDQALDAYRKAEGIRPGYVPAVFGQGAVFHEMGRKEEAIAAYVRVIRLSGNHLPALNNLAYLYAEEGREPVKALRLALRAYVIAPYDGPVLDTLGLALLRNRRAGEALEALKRAIKAMPGNPGVYYHLSLAYRELGDRGKAVENLERALRAGDFPESGDARLLRDKMMKGQVPREGT